MADWGDKQASKENAVSPTTIRGGMGKHWPNRC